MIIPLRHAVQMKLRRPPNWLPKTRQSRRIGAQHENTSSAEATTMYFNIDRGQLV